MDMQHKTTKALFEIFSHQTNSKVHSPIAQVVPSPRPWARNDSLEEKLALIHGFDQSAGSLAH